MARIKNAIQLRLPRRPQGKRNFKKKFREQLITVQAIYPTAKGENHKNSLLLKDWTQQMKKNYVQQILRFDKHNQNRSHVNPQAFRRTLPRSSLTLKEKLDVRKIQYARHHNKMSMFLSSRTFYC